MILLWRTCHSIYTAHGVAPGLDVSFHGERSLKLTPGNGFESVLVIVKAMAFDSIEMGKPKITRRYEPGLSWLRSVRNVEQRVRSIR